MDGMADLVSLGTDCKSGVQQRIVGRVERTVGNDQCCGRRDSSDDNLRLEGLCEHDPEVCTFLRDGHVEPYD